MRLLFISSFYLFKDTRFGGTKRLYYFAREWEKRAELTLICMDGCMEWKEGRSDGGGFSDFLMVPGNDAPGWGDRLFKAPADRGKFLEGKLDSIRAHLRGKRFDAVLLAFPWALSFLGEALKDSLGPAPIHYLEDDLLLEQFKSRPGSDSLPRRLRKEIRRRQTLAYYRPRLGSLSRFIGISSQETDAMREAFPGLACSVIRYGIPLDEFPALPLRAGNPVFGFIGNYGHTPNLDALTWLFDGVMPAIRAACPRSRFILAGKGFPDWARRRGEGDASVELREDVPDLRGFYADISVFLNPIRTGKGLRTKLIEAAAFGRPIVTTALGGEGLADLELAVAEDAGTFAAEALRLAEGDAGAEAAARNRRTIENAYDLEKVAADFLALMRAPGAPA